MMLLVILWERNIKENYSYLENSTYLIASESGSYVYFIEKKGNVNDSKILYITQFDRNGVEKLFEIKGKKEFGTNLQAIYCDDEYLYFLTTVDGNELNDKKKINEKLILNRFNTANMAHKRLPVDVTSIKDGKSTTFWSYLGQNGSENYLLSKNINKETGKCNFSLATINSEGKVVKIFLIDIDLDDKFLRPGYNVNNHNKGYEIVADMDYESKMSGSSAPNMGTTYSIRNYATTGAFSQLLFDADHKMFYAFGLFGPKPFKELGSVYEGFYIYKFDMEGKNIWSLKQMASKDLEDEGIFRVHGTPADREISLTVLPDQSLNFSIHFRGKLFTHEISDQGRMLSIRKKEKHISALDNTILLTSKKLFSEDFIKKNYTQKNKDIVFGNSLSDDGEFLWEINSNTSKLRILYFNNKL